MRCAESERVKSKVGEVQGVDEDDDKRNYINKKCETMVNGVSVRKSLQCIDQLPISI